MTPAEVHEALHRAADDRHGSLDGDLLREVGRTLGVALELVAEARMTRRTGGGEDQALRYLERVQAPSWLLRRRTEEVVDADVAELLREGLRAACAVAQEAKEAQLASMIQARISTKPAAVAGVRGAL